jgi:LysM repeat protein
MTRMRVAAVGLVLEFSLSVALFTPIKALPSLGQHTVLPGETLYCIGRGYGVTPWAIAQANGLAVLARLYVGQVLSIPAVPWTPIPPGPSCAPQFPLSTLAAPAAVTTVICPGTVYTVVRGDTLWRISLRYQTTVRALKQANNLYTHISSTWANGWSSRCRPAVLPLQCPPKQKAATTPATRLATPASRRPPPSCRPCPPIRWRPHRPTPCRPGPPLPRRRQPPLAPASRQRRPPTPRRPPRTRRRRPAHPEGRRIRPSKHGWANG